MALILYFNFEKFYRKPLNTIYVVLQMDALWRSGKDRCAFLVLGNTCLGWDQKKMCCNPKIFVSISAQILIPCRYISRFNGLDGTSQESAPYCITGVI